MSTFFPRKEDITRKWFVVNAEGKPLGRIASFVANILSGKRNPMYTPHTDMGDHVIIINADKAVLTGKKMKFKAYRRHSSRPGGLKEVAAEHMFVKHPTRPLELAIKGMLPKTKLGRAMYRKLKVYSGTEHPHQAQEPEHIEPAL
jgi:large subunit ribosomal protein L13